MSNCIFTKWQNSRPAIKRHTTFYVDFLVYVLCRMTVIEIDDVHYRAGEQPWNSLVMGRRLQPVVYCSQRRIRRRKCQ